MTFRPQAEGILKPCGQDDKSWSEMIWKSLDLAIVPVGIEIKQHREKWLIGWGLSTGQLTIPKQRLGEAGGEAGGVHIPYWFHPDSQSQGVCKRLQSLCKFTPRVPQLLCLSRCSLSWVVLTPNCPLILCSFSWCQSLVLSNQEIRHLVHQLHPPPLHQPDSFNPQQEKNLDALHEVKKEGNVH